MNSFKFTLLALALFLFVSCGGGGAVSTERDANGGSNGGTPPISGKNPAVDPLHPGDFAASGSPIANCTARSNTSTGLVDYSAETNTADPLAKYLWFIDNRCQLYINGQYIDSKISSNISYVHNQLRITGKNVLVAVLDEGIDVNHEDLVVDKAKSYNLQSSNFDISPKSVEESHGTAVAGVIGAKQGNGLGTVGVAPGSIIVGYRLASSGGGVSLNSMTLPIALGLKVGSVDISKNNQVLNISLGSSLLTNSPKNDIFRAVFRQAAIDARNGKGSIVLNSAGNDYLGVSGYLGCEKSKALDVTCRPAGFSSAYSDQSVIKVGSANPNNTHTSYSQAGTELFVVGFGGEFPAKNRGNTCGTSTDIKNCLPNIITTDVMGCTYGESRTGEAANTDFNYVLNNGTVYGPSSLNPNCNYTEIQGTSFSSPFVAGVVALVLEKNPNLSYRQIKHLFAKTSTQVEANNPGRFVTLGGNKYIIENPWQRNGAGFNYQARYGYGLVNARLLVEQASDSSIPSLSPASITETSLSIPAIPKVNKATSIAASAFNAGATTMAYNINFNKPGITHLDAVQIVFSGTANQSKKGGLGHLIVRLQSPRMTKSIIVQPFSVWVSDSYTLGDSQTNALLGSNEFFGENPNGDWKVDVFDMSEDAALELKISKMEFLFYGS